jgi:hypothetical protein
LNRPQNLALSVRLNEHLAHSGELVFPAVRIWATPLRPGWATGRDKSDPADGRVILEADNFVGLLSHHSEAFGRRPIENEDYLFCGLGYCED